MYSSKLKKLTAHCRKTEDVSPTAGLARTIHDRNTGDDVSTKPLLPRPAAQLFQTMTYAIITSRQKFSSLCSDVTYIGVTLQATKLC